MTKSKTVTVGRGKEPLGNLCILRDESLNSWAVMLCKGITGDRTPLGRFGSRGEADAFARQQMEKLNSGPGDKITILYVDDCPCWQKEL